MSSRDEPSSAIERNEPRLVTLTSPGNTATQTLIWPPSVDPEGRITALFASPRGIMILVPLLVLALGAALTVIGQLALGAVSRTMAQDRFLSDTLAVSRGLENTLGQAEPLIDELERIGRAVQPLEARLPGKSKKAPEAYDEKQIGPVALELRDLLVGRPGITQAYIAYPNGVFISADPAGPRSVGIQVTKDGRSTSFQVKGQRVHRINRRKSKYDPRTRDWYKLATSKKERVWSAPYTFFFNQHTGVTRSFPVYKDEEKTQLLGVVGVDFDVDALTAFMAATQSVDDVHAVVFTLGGVVLAYPRGAEQLAKLQERKKVPTHEALDDPELSALIRQVQSAPNQRSGLLSFTAGKAPMLASVRRVGSAGPDWYVATFSPERSVLRELYDHRKSSLLIGTLSLLFAVSLAWFLARRVLIVRRAAHAAQEAAQLAQDQVRDLGSYRLVSRIGEGGMGEVWRASHRLLARQAAIKLIKADAAVSERKDEQRERFRREAQAIAGLRSRNTIALYDYGVTADDRLFYVMELLDGIDLNTLVSEHGPQNPERVRRILLQACSSLGEAHNAQLVHRDIKPANLFLCREAEDVDVVKVLDFGLVFRADTLDESALSSKSVAREALKEAEAEQSSNVDNTMPTSANEARITRADHQLGTPAFMSPEQALGAGTDGRSDIYSLACVAWWLLAGKPPFKADSAMALMLKHIEEPPPPLSPLVLGKLSSDFEQLLLSCLAKSPLDRPQSAQELSDQLRLLGEQTPGWSDDQTRLWWKEHVPIQMAPTGKPSLPPLRGAEVLPPKEAV